MIWTFIKKNFFDGWENIGNIILANLINIPFGASVAFGFYLAYISASETENSMSLFDIFHQHPLIPVLFIFFGLFFAIVLGGAYAKNADSISNNEVVKINTYFNNVGKAFKDYSGFALLVSGIFIACLIGVPFYIQLSSFFGVMIGAILLLFSVVFLLAFQWFIPLKELLGFKFKKTIDKCFVILFDNFAFSVFMALYSLLLMALSVMLLFTMPGFCGINLAYVNALRLRMYKYDWLDQHGDLKGKNDRNNIPWKALLKEETDILDQKSIRSVLMPWKSKDEE